MSVQSWNFHFTHVGPDKLSEGLSVRIGLFLQLDLFLLVREEALLVVHRYRFWLISLTCSHRRSQLEVFFERNFIRTPRFLLAFLFQIAL